LPLPSKTESVGSLKAEAKLLRPTKPGPMARIKNFFGSPGPTTNPDVMAYEPEPAWAREEKALMRWSAGAEIRNGATTLTHASQAKAAFNERDFIFMGPKKGPGMTRHGDKCSPVDGENFAFMNGAANR